MMSRNIQAYLWDLLLWKKVSITWPLKRLILISSRWEILCVGGFVCVNHKYTDTKNIFPNKYALLTYVQTRNTWMSWKARRWGSKGWGSGRENPVIDFLLFWLKCMTNYSVSLYRWLQSTKMSSQVSHSFSFTVIYGWIKDFSLDNIKNRRDYRFVLLLIQDFVNITTCELIDHKDKYHYGARERAQTHTHTYAPPYLLVLVLA